MGSGGKKKMANPIKLRKPDDEKPIESGYSDELEEKLTINSIRWICGGLIIAGLILYHFLAPQQRSEVDKTFRMFSDAQKEYFESRNFAIDDRETIIISVPF